MIKNITKLEVQVGDKIYHLLCDADSPLDHVKEALFQMVKFIGTIEDNARKAREEAQQDSENEEKSEPS